MVLLPFLHSTRDRKGEARVCSQSGNHQANNLAKFGYILKQNRILLCFWLLTGTYHQNLADFELFSLKSGEFESFFPHEKILCIG
jgi:hypothetical protein